MRLLRPFVLSATLSMWAQQWANHMAVYGMAHGDFQGRMRQAGYVGSENIAMGYPDAETVVRGWMTSRMGHKENILGPFGEAGFGRAVSSAGTIFWCGVYGNRVTQAMAAAEMEYPLPEGLVA